jgi:hypothetical protein
MRKQTSSAITTINTNDKTQQSYEQDLHFLHAAVVFHRKRYSAAILHQEAIVRYLVAVFAIQHLQFELHGIVLVWL